MRLSEWRVVAPHRDALSPKVEAAVVPVLTGLGTEADPDCWIVWGDDPGTRWSVMVPTESGLAAVNVRVNVPQEGPRAAGKLVRWHRVQLGDLSVETQNGHRLLSFQIEGHVMRGVDDECDAMSAFVRRVFAAVDGRPLPEPSAASSTRAARPRSSASKSSASRS